MTLELSEHDLALIIHCINTNATIESHIKEETLKVIREQRS